MLIALDKAPFPWFGGKRHAAPAVWSALGDVEHYVEPFCGSLAVLLCRPHLANRAYHSETVNDADGLLVNACRSIQFSPDATADAASWPVAEADLHARHVALVRWKTERQLDHLMGDPAFHDPVMGGWWVWGQSSWIGGGWCSGAGSWFADADGRLVKRESSAPGVARKIQNISDDGRGVTHAGAREPGVTRPRPEIGMNGRGVNNPGVREPGVSRQCPDINNNGQGVNHPGAREPGVGSEPEYHPMTMPEVRRWFSWLSARLRHVRILNGDWRRATTNGALKTLSVRQGGHAGVFLDPPYADTAGRDAALYAHDSLSVAHEVHAWCLERGPDPQLRIVLAGFEGAHGPELEAAGWRCVEWFRKGFLRGGMGTLAGHDQHQQGRERLWLSPACRAPRRQGSLFEAQA